MYNILRYLKLVHGHITDCLSSHQEAWKSCSCCVSMPPGAAAGGCTVSSAGRCSQQGIWSSIQGRRAGISHQRLQSLVPADTLRIVSSVLSEANYAAPLFAGRVKNITTSCLLLMSQFSHNVAVLPNTWLRFTALFWAVASSPILSLLIQNCYFCLLMYGAPLCLQMHCFTAIIFHCMLRNACWRWSADS